jgi:hypothetical protein
MECLHAWSKRIVSSHLSGIPTDSEISILRHANFILIKQVISYSNGLYCLLLGSWLVMIFFSVTNWFSGSIYTEQCIKDCPALEHFWHKSSQNPDWRHSSRDERECDLNPKFGSQEEKTKKRMESRYDGGNRTSNVYLCHRVCWEQ